MARRCAAPRSVSGGSGCKSGGADALELIRQTPTIYCPSKWGVTKQDNKGELRMSLKTSWWRRFIILGAMALLFSAFAGPIGYALASHPEVSLPGSNFEIDTDANIKVDDPAPSIDWANVSEIRKADSPSGANDESFGQGSKEDTAVPSVVDGSIPPNKSDLKFFGIFQEGGSTSGFLHLFWSRVQ